MTEREQLVDVNRPMPLLRAPKWRGRMKRLRKSQNFRTPMQKGKRTNPDYKEKTISCNLVSSANTLFNPLCQLVPCYQTFKYLDGTPDGQMNTVHVLCRRCSDLKDFEREACFNLVYESWPTPSDVSPAWNKIQKWREMFDCYNAWFIICRSKGCLVGFVHFRFEVRFTKAVLVCKDLYLSQHVRGKGLGRHLMQLQLELAKKVRLDMVAIAMPKHVSSLPFFKNLGFEQQIGHDSIPQTLENAENFMPTYTLSQSI